MHDTEATTITSLRANTAAVAAWRSRSTSWLIARVLLDVEIRLGTYASGW